MFDVYHALNYLRAPAYRIFLPDEWCHNGLLGMIILTKDQMRLDAKLGVDGLRLAQNFNFEAGSYAVFALSVIMDQRYLKS